MESKINPYTQESVKNNLDWIINEATPYFDKNHLDIGCGKGELLYHYSKYASESKILGYDPDPEAIKMTHHLHFSNREFTDSYQEVVQKSPFDSANSFFVYHESGSDIFNSAFQNLKTNGFFVIIDYNLKGLNFDEFKNVFNAPPEIKEAQNMGWFDTFLIHTRFNHKDCQKTSEKYGFKTLKSEVSQEFPKFFVWVGQKQG